MTPEQFRKAIAALGWKQGEAAQELGVTIKTVNNYACGRTEIPKILADYLKLRVGQIR